MLVKENFTVSDHLSMGRGGWKSCSQKNPKKDKCNQQKDNNKDKDWPFKVFWNFSKNGEHGNWVVLHCQSFRFLHCLHWHLQMKATMLFYWKRVHQMQIFRKNILILITIFLGTAPLETFIDYNKSYYLHFSRNICYLLQKENECCIVTLSQFSWGLKILML